MTVRIFNVCHSTPLMVVQHLRQHLKLPAAQEFLVWHPLGQAPWMDGFMQQIIRAAGFTDTLDIRNFECLEPRTAGSVTWWFQSAQKLRRDARIVHRWMEKNHIVDNEVELWTEDPIHFNTMFARAMWPNARHIKFPHCFYLEDADTPNYKVRLEQRWTNASWSKRHLFWPWLRLMSGVDYCNRCVFDRGYTFDAPSTWALNSLDVSELISLEAFRQTYRALPTVVREDIERQLLPLQTAKRPLILLLLFGLSPQLRQLYQNSITRIFAERSELKESTLVVKVHPGTQGREEEIFFQWLKENVSVPAIPLRNGLNLEFILPQLRPDFVWAGPCGALPILRKLKSGVPIVLPEITDFFIRTYPTEVNAYAVILRNIQVW